MAISIEELRNSTKKIQQQDDPLDSNFATDLISNIPQSAAKFVRDVLTPVLDPQGFVTDVGDLALSIVSKIPGVPGDESTANAVGSFLKERYGGKANIVRTMRDDPVGFVGDLSLLFVGGGAALRAGKLGTVADEIGAGAITTGQTIDPLVQAGRLADEIGAFGDIATAASVRNIQAAASGVKPQALEIAFREGATDQGFKDARTGKLSQEDIVRNAEKKVKDFSTQINEKLTEAGVAAKLKTKKLTDTQINRLSKAVEEIKKDNMVSGQSSLDRREISLLNKIEKDIQDLLSDKSRYNAENLRVVIRKVDKLRPAPTDANRVARGIHSRIRADIKRIFDDTPGVSQDYKNALSEFSDNQRKIDRAKSELGLGKKDTSKESTIFNNLKATLRSTDSIPENVLLDIPGGREVLNQVAGNLSKEFLPGEFLRTAPGLGIGGGLTLFTGNPLPLVASGVAISPRIGSELQPLAGQARRAVPRLRAGLLEDLRGPLTAIRPLEQSFTETEDLR